MNKNEREKAIEQVSEWLAKGFTKSNIIKMIKSLYGIKSYSGCNRLINDASESIMKDLDSSSLKFMITERLDTIIEQAMQSKTHTSAIKAIEAYSRVIGLLNNNKEVSIKDNDTNKSYIIKFE